jgi:putative DNA primase/helicase
MRISGVTGATGPRPAGTGAAGLQRAGEPSPPDPKTGAPAPPNFLRPNFERIPAELKERPNWVLWVPTWTGSKWTKRPIQPSGFGASTTKPNHWSSFDEVRQAYERAVERGYIEVFQKRKPARQLPIGGVGFVFDGKPDEDGFVFAGVDFDKVITGRNVASLAGERIRRLGSYVEASVSRTGVHVILKARPLASGIAHDGIEMYTVGRFFTMTGRAPEDAQIVAAPDAFAALAQELQAQSSRTDESHQSSTSCSAKSKHIDAGWFSKLPPENQSEVVKYAALHITHNTNLFELTANGGSYQEYFKLALAIARSGVPDAEDLFVEAASRARDADSEEELRGFFQECEGADPRANGVTVGTLFHIAHQCGADFSEQIAAGPDVAVYTPGNEEECRKLLDRVVAADHRTYTLGDPTGPLVIMRIPKEDELPADTQWEGDLPGTTLAMSADIMQRAEQLEWRQRAGGKAGNRVVRTHPPRAFVSDYLVQMRGQYGARPLCGIVRVPRIDDTGHIHFVSGYDTQTGLFHDKALTFDVPLNPSLDDARSAMESLLRPFSEYQFDDPDKGRAVLLAAIFTAIERPFLPVVPMFVVRSSMPGTGKGLIVRSLVRLAFDTVPVVVTWGGDNEEFEKRLGALLLQAPGALSIDNANGIHIKGDLLEAILTEGSADIRPLGRSETIRVRSRSFIALTGNNPTITGDMARRALPIEIVPRSADPERDRYPFNPVEVIQRNRTKLLEAAFIAMRAFRLAGMPSSKLPAVGSFDGWSHHVRDFVYWLTGYDVSEAFHQNKAEDPRRQDDAALMAALYDKYGSKEFKSSDVFDVYSKVSNFKRAPGDSGIATADLALHDALERVLGSRRVDAKSFGYWARRVNGARLGGFMLEAKHDPAKNANVITIKKP